MKTKIRLTSWVVTENVDFDELKSLLEHSTGKRICLGNTVYQISHIISFERDALDYELQLKNKSVYWKSLEI